tara:strand:- start:325 stop:552 length:228 start_codon:yes stop_codon:yes gene_type:complete
MKNLNLKTTNEVEESFSNTFLISVAVGQKERQSLIVVLENIIRARDAREHLRSMGIQAMSVQRLQKIDAQNQWFS